MNRPLCCTLALVMLAAAYPLAAAPATVDFAAKIAPLFEEHCVDCHAANDADGELSLETFEALLKGGKSGKAINAGNAQDSLLVKFLEGRSGKEGKNKFMPPGKKEHLKPEEIALIRQWIDAGAPAPALPAKSADVLASLPKIPAKTNRQKGIQALAFSAKANLLATGSYATVQLLDAATRQPKRTLDGIAGKVNALCFSQDGTMLFAAAGDAGLAGVAYQWKLADGALVRKFEGHKDALYALALSADGQTLATGSYDQKIKLWSTADGQEVRTLNGHNGGVFGLSFRPDGKVLASASADRTVKLWDVATGKRLDTFSQPLKEQTAVAFAPNGQTVVAGGVDNRIRIWSVSAEAQEGSNPLLFTRFAHEGAILNLAFLADGKTLVSTAADRTAKVWTTADLTEQRLLETQSDWAPGLAVLNGVQLALGRLDGSIAWYNSVTGAPAPLPPAAKPAPAAPPEITRFEPRGLTRGVTTTIKVIGKNLAGLQSVKFASPELSAIVTSVDPNAMSAELAVTATEKAPRAQVEASLVTSAGESPKKKLFVDDLPQIVASASPQPQRLDTLPANVWGTLASTGQRDEYTFAAKKGQTIVCDLAARRVESKAESTRLEILDAERRLLATNNGLDTGSDPFIAFTAPREGEFTVRVLEVTLEGSPEHAYRLTVGELPYVTGWWPLSLRADSESEVHLVGPNLPVETVRMKAGEGEVVKLPETSAYRSRVTMRAAASTMAEFLEQEPNDTPDRAQTLTPPFSINGRLMSADGTRADFDLYRFKAEKGEQLVLETRAAMLGSPADTKLEVLDAKGEAVPRLLLQATKDSWLTLRSADSSNAGIRLGQFTEMELNDYMYFNGEVVKIFRLARGPDADMSFYARSGTRRGYFDTSASGHGLDEPCYVVEPKPVGAKIVATGLPIFTLNYTNDDDSERQLGKDSKLTFTAPATGHYFVRVSDTRGWSGERFAYRLIVRKPAPGFTATFAAKAATPLPAGSGQQLLVRVDRADGFDGQVRVDVSGVPAGFFVSTPIVVEAGHLTATGCVYALPEAKIGAADFSKIKMTATATVGGQPVVKAIEQFPSLTVAAPPKEAIFLEPEQASGKPRAEAPAAPAQPFEITVTPGGRVPAWLRVARNGNDKLLALNIEGLPHGVIVDSIGLNGVQVREGENEREIFLSCAGWVAEQDRLCHAVIGNAGGAESVEGLPASFPVLLKVRRANAPQTMSVK